MSATSTTTVIFFLFLSLILLGLLWFLFNFIKTKIAQNRNSVRKEIPVRVTPQQTYEGTPFSRKPNRFSNTLETLLNTKQTLFDKSRTETGAERISQEKLSEDSSKNFAVFVKKPERMTVLTTVSSENDFSRPYYNTNVKETKN
ncbi:MAG: hypothetical protein AB9882_03640 [Ignavibacteriaceae bacterium]